MELSTFVYSYLFVIRNRNELRFATAVHSVKPSPRLVDIIQGCVTIIQGCVKIIQGCVNIIPRSVKGIPRHVNTTAASAKHFPLPVNNIPSSVSSTSFSVQIPATSLPASQSQIVNR